MIANEIRSVSRFGHRHSREERVALLSVSIECREKRGSGSLARYRTDILDRESPRHRVTASLYPSRSGFGQVPVSEFSLDSKNHSFRIVAVAPVHATMPPNARWRIVRLTSKSLDESAEKIGGREEITSCGGDCSSPPNFSLSLSLSLSLPPSLPLFLRSMGFCPALRPRRVPSSPAARHFCP